MRDVGTNEASTVDSAAVTAEAPGPGKQSLTEKASATSTRKDGDAQPGPGKQSLVERVERAEQRLARPGYQYLSPFARPLIAEARKPGADAALGARLDRLFEVSKTDGAGDLHDAKEASNAYHARLGEQAITELGAKAPAGSPAARATLEPVAHTLEAKYAPLLEDDVHLIVHLGQIAAKNGGHTPAVSLEVSIRPNDFSCFGWLSWDGLASLWRVFRTPAPTDAPPASTERTPLLGGEQAAPVVQQPQPQQPPVMGGASSSSSSPPVAKTTEVASEGAPADGKKPADAPAPEEATAFAAKFKATGIPTANAVGAPKISPHPSSAPAEGGEKQPGYVINMAAVPGEVHGDMATRYFDGERAKDADRTAVVVGVNSFLGMDGGKDGDKIAAVTKGISQVEAPKGQMAVFGYTWDPGWLNEANQAVPLSAVREEWRKLPAHAQAPAAKEMDTLVKSTLPYGFFRNQVLNSTYTKQAVTDVGKHADPVHIVVQDADGGIESASGKHVLSAYDEVLKDMARQPLLTIGGYHFQGYDWPADSLERTKRLTLLSNEVDRAIRAAIAKVYPEMLYPTEPNMLIKAQDQEHHDGVFDRHLEDTPGGLFGLGASEGRTARQNIMRANNAPGADKNDAPITYTPTTSTMTSPVPERPERGLTVPGTSEYVETATDGTLYQSRTGAASIKPDKQYASLVVEEQSQNPLAPRRLNQEFLGAWEQHDPGAAPITSGNKKKVKTAFEQPAAAVKGITAEQVAPVEPEPVAPASEVVDASNEASSSSAPAKGKKAKAPKQAKAAPPVDAAVAKAQQVAQEIVTAMNEPKMKAIWDELRTILVELQREGEAKKKDKSKEEAV